MALPKWFLFFREQATLEPGDALMLDGSDVADIELGVGDVAIFHGDLRDYTAEIVGIDPATRYVEERFHLNVYTPRGDVLTWVWCTRERLTLLIKAAALTNASATA